MQSDGETVSHTDRSEERWNRRRGEEECEEERGARLITIATQATRRRLIAGPQERDTAIRAWFWSVGTQDCDVKVCVYRERAS